MKSVVVFSINVLKQSSLNNVLIYIYVYKKGEKKFSDYCIPIQQNYLNVFFIYFIFNTTIFYTYIVITVTCTGKYLLHK